VPTIYYRLPIVRTDGTFKLPAIWPGAGRPGAGGQVMVTSQWHNMTRITWTFRVTSPGLSQSSTPSRWGPARGPGWPPLLAPPEAAAAFNGGFKSRSHCQSESQRVTAGLLCRRLQLEIGGPSRPGPARARRIGPRGRPRRRSRSLRDGCHRHGSDFRVGQEVQVGRGSPASRCQPHVTVTERYAARAS
jgi:hypothetical protein